MVAELFFATAGPSDFEGMTSVVRIEWAEDRREWPVDLAVSGVSTVPDSGRSSCISVDVDG